MEERQREIREEKTPEEIREEDREEKDPEEGGGECCCSQRRKERSPEEYKALLNRLSRIEGQIRGIKTMVEQNAYCTDILVQVAAASSALNSFSRVLLENHLRTCVTQDILEGKEGTVDDLMRTLNRLIR